MLRSLPLPRPRKAAKSMAMCWCCKTRRSNLLLNRCCHDRATRQTIYESSWGRTKERGRRQRYAGYHRTVGAGLPSCAPKEPPCLGFRTTPHGKLKDQMAKTPWRPRGVGFMDALVPVATAKAAPEESADIQALIDQQHGGFTLEPWDWDFYAKQVRKARYSLDDAQIKPYFELGVVLQNGVFYAANQLYGLTFKERKDIPGVSIRHARFRSSRRRRQAARALLLRLLQTRQQEWRRVDVVVRGSVQTAGHAARDLQCRQPTGSSAAGEPALISFEDVRTMFHEFGHALHGMLANTRYPSLSFAATARDFVEFPSQFNEHWAIYPAVFDHFCQALQDGRGHAP